MSLMFVVRGMHMKYLKIALVAAAVQLFVPTVSAQEANAEVATMFATAQAQGQSLTDFVAQITNLQQPVSTVPRSWSQVCWRGSGVFFGREPECC